MKKFITVHCEIDKKTLKPYGFLAEALNVDKESTSLEYYDLDTGTSLGSAWFLEFNQVAIFQYKNQKEKNTAIAQAQKILDEYLKK